MVSFWYNIDEILLNLIKSQNKYNEIHNHAIYYANMFTMDDGHICKNPIIKLKKKKIIGLKLIYLLGTSQGRVCIIGKIV